MCSDTTLVALTTSGGAYLAAKSPNEEQKTKAENKIKKKAENKRKDTETRENHVDGLLEDG